MAERDDIEPKDAEGTDSAATGQRADAEGPGEETGSVLDGPPREASVKTWIGENPKRAALLGAGALVVLALLGWGIASAFDGRDAADDREGVSESADLVSDDASEDAEPSMDDTTTAEDSADETDDDAGDGPGVNGTDADSDEDDGVETFVDADMVAFRMGDEIWVAKTDGSEARYVTELPDGTYALAPDGTAIVLVDVGGWHLMVVDLEPEEPRPFAFDYGAEGISSGVVAWSPDSAWFAYVSNLAVWRVGRDGSGPASYGQGSEPLVHPDAEVLAYLTAPLEGEKLLAVVEEPGGDPVTYTPEGRIVDFTWVGEDIVYIARDDSGLTTIRRGSVDDLVGEELVGPPESPGLMVGYRGLLPSPDGDWLAYTTVGDDGYSRLFVIRPDGGSRRELSIRRDAYPLRWTADGERILFIEGNEFQGEDTRLMSVRPDGTGRITLVEGAGL